MKKLDEYFKIVSLIIEGQRGAKHCLSSLLDNHRDNKANLEVSGLFCGAERLDVVLGMLEKNSGFSQLFNMFPEEEELTLGLHISDSMDNGRRGIVSKYYMKISKDSGIVYESWYQQGVAVQKEEEEGNHLFLDMVLTLKSDGTIPEMKFKYITEEEEEALAEKSAYQKSIFASGKSIILESISVWKKFSKYLSERLYLETSEFMDSYSSLTEIFKRLKKDYDISRDEAVSLLNSILPSCDLSFEKITDQDLIKIKGHGNAEFTVDSMDALGSGAKKLCIMLPVLFSARKNNRLLLIDYFSSCLHPLLAGAIEDAVFDSKQGEGFVISDFN